MTIKKFQFYFTLYLFPQGNKSQFLLIQKFLNTLVSFKLDLKYQNASD